MNVEVVEVEKDQDSASSNYSVFKTDRFNSYYIKATGSITDHFTSPIMKSQVSTNQPIIQQEESY